MAVSLIALLDNLLPMSEATGYGGFAHRNLRSREGCALRLDRPIPDLQVHRRLVRLAVMGTATFTEIPELDLAEWVIEPGAFADRVRDVCHSIG